MGRVFYRIPTKEKIAAITFDDGPNDPYTSAILDTLKTHGVRATFFLVGDNAKRHKETVIRIAREGHAIGNHSSHHLFRNYIIHHNFGLEIAEAQKTIKEISNAEPTLYRSPWLYRTPGILKAVKKLDMLPVWGRFASPFEIFQPKAAKIVNGAMRRLKPGTIFIFHDGYNNKGAYREKTVEAVELLITELEKRGYKLVPLSKDLFIDKVRIS